MRFTVLLLFTVVGCGESNAAIDSSACTDGVAPAITECVDGYHYADCGGHGEPDG